jgi:DNA-binding transcriptional MerR regulator
VSTLVTIGDFSRMTYLTVKALRHYHDIGLLEPVSVDAQNGYRLYGTDQVAVAQTIRRFRELDMSTDDIRSVLVARSEAERDAVIVAHLDRMEGRLEQTRSTIAGLRTLLEDAGAVTDVAYRELVPVLALAIREHVRFEDAAGWCERAYGEIHDLLDARGAEADGPDGALYTQAFFEDGEGAVTAFVPVRGDLPTSGRVVQVEVPGFDAAIAVHAGSFDDLDQTYRGLGTQVAELGIGVDGPMREHYLDDTTIEVCWPVSSQVPEP